MTKILVSGRDHDYYEARLVEDVEVVYNKKYDTYKEYHGPDYLQEGDVVIKRTIVE